MAGITTRSRVRDSNVASAHEFLYVNFLSEIEPKKLIEALEEEGWVTAMQEELNQFERNKVWTLVPKPYGKTIIGTKWIWKNKMDEEGAITKNKAKLVAQGYNQQEGIDYEETLHLLQYWKLSESFLLMQPTWVLGMDVKSAFLNGKISEEVYVQQPPRFDSEFPDHVCKLDKALYGLKQAPRAWYETLSTFLIQHKFVRDAGWLFDQYLVSKDTYDKVDGSSVFNLHKSINSLNQSSASLADCYNNLNSLWKQFDDMVTLHACTCEAAIYFEKHNQLIKLMQFLMGLDDNYLAIRSNILTREPLPLVKVAFAIFSGEESHRNITFVGATKPTATAFAAKSFDKKSFNSNNYNKGSSSNLNSINRGPNLNLKCINFNKIGHTVDRCFKLVGYPAGYVKRNFNPTSRSVSSNNTYANVHSNGVTSNNATTNNSPISFSNEQLTRLMNLLNDNGVSTASANMVGHLNGTQALITKIGDLKINNDTIMYDVLVVLECTISLLFVHKLSGDSKFFVGFDESNCYIQDLMANITVGIDSVASKTWSSC
ncbi:retrovirus-related pol polyprotein from transposon TNT 1-94 [Tanacetum coccineum]